MALVPEKYDFDENKFRTIAEGIDPTSVTMVIVNKQVLNNLRNIILVGNLMAI